MEFFIPIVMFTISVPADWLESRPEAVERRRRAQEARWRRLEELYRLKD